jgi:hypothetical protein
MSLLRRVRAEVSGAMRSVRYDMGRRPAEPPADGPDVTSTGMNTFGGQLLLDDRPQPATHRPPRRPRRAVAVTVFGVLTVVGATGAYLGVVNGLGSLLNETPAAADTFPPQPAMTATDTPNAGIGGGPGRAARPAATATPGATPGAIPGPGAPAGAVPVAPVDPADPAAVVPGHANMSPIRTTKPTKPECACDRPPAPTPTAPSTSTSTSPSGAPSDSPYPSQSGDPSPSETSATPSDSAEPSDSPQARHRRRHY